MIKLPEVIRIEPAGSCNLKCVHCPTGQGLVGDVGVMRWSTFEEVTRKIAPHAPYSAIVLYHGGEPLLNGKFVDMVKSVRPLCRKIRTVSNGTLINRQKAKDIANSGLDEITISIDGASAEDNDKIRVGAKFIQLVEATRLLAEEATGNLTIIVSNSDASNMAREFMCKEFANMPSRVVLRQNHFIVWPAQIGKTKKHVVMNNYCDKTYETVTIRWNGDIVPCCFDLASQGRMGSILESSLEEIWNNEKYTGFRKRIYDRDPPDMCQACYVLNAPPYAYKEMTI
jgi:radical SAM protein with 4Fe4S-binding SPASM domain